MWVCFCLEGSSLHNLACRAVYGAEVGLSVAQISLFAATFYIFATLLQYPLGWLSDRMDRRLLILLTALIAASGAFIGYFFSHNYIFLLVAAGLIGGFSNPLYSLLIAHANDYLDFDDMAAASGGLVFITGVGGHCWSSGYRMGDGADWTPWLFWGDGFFALCDGGLCWLSDDPAQCDCG